MRPNSLCGPVETTIPVPVPLAMTVPISAQLLNSPRAVPGGTGSTPFATGSDSPVRTDSSQVRATTDSRRMSAGTTSPRRRCTTSPGTSSVTSTEASEPSRITTAR